MKRSAILLILLTFFSYNLCSQTRNKKPIQKKDFIHVNGQNLVMQDGRQFNIKGIGLGNWLNPEGYMFQLPNSANSYRTMDQAFKEMVGEAFTNSFWQKFQQKYISREDIHYISEVGMNTIRLPFHYKLLTDEPFMGYASRKHGYAVLDSIIGWCRDEGLYVVLDMHDAPGGQTGDNIDDSYGYPWLFVTEQHKQLFCEIWKEIAKHYAKEPTVLGYDLINEPIGSLFFPKDNNMLGVELDSLYRRVSKDIRSEDKNHIIILGGSRWDQDFSIITDWKFDNNIMFTCHRYGCDTTETFIRDFLDYRTKFNLPFYYGEAGESNDKCVAAFRRFLDRLNLGWTYWPYKKMRSTSGVLSINQPEDWNVLRTYIQSSRVTFADIRKNRPDQEVVRKAMDEFIYNLDFSRCIKNEGYIKALGMKP